MRPSDENQHGTTRPNLMSSSHRGGNSDGSILARMDKARGLSTRARTAWLAAAGTLIAALIATIAWLAHTSMTTPRALPVESAKTTLPPGSVEMGHDAPAQVVNEPQRPDAAALPPLVTLPRTSVAAPAAAVRVPLPVRTLAVTPRAPEPQARPAMPPPRAATPARAPLRVAAARKAKPAPVADATEAAPVDLDIALISAVVASRHRAEQAACAENASCPPRP